MKLTVIGCGDAFSSGGRRNTCFLLETDEATMLLDCGATSLTGLNELNIDPTTIDIVFVSHFHGDHYGGLPFLIIDRKYNRPVNKPLHIVGPQGIKSKLKSLQSEMYPGSEELLDDLPIIFTEFSPGEEQRILGLKVLSMPVKHSMPSHPHGYRISTKKGSIGFSGDTEWNDNLIPLSNQTDLFLLECNDLHDDVPGHLCYKTLLKHVDQLKSNRVVLTHMGEDMLKEKADIEKLHDGQVISF